MGDGVAFSTCATSPASSASAYWSMGRKTSPGLVQNWPTPNMNDPKRPTTISPARLCNASGSMKKGLVLLISIKHGMGSGRSAAICIKALPADNDPVKPTALTAGCCTSADPTCAPEPKIKANVPAGRPHSFTLLQITCPTHSLVPGCAECALTITDRKSTRL